MVRLIDIPLHTFTIEPHAKFLAQRPGTIATSSKEDLMRNRMFYLALVLSLSCAGMASAQEHGKAIGPRRLADRQLDRITAGDSDAGNSGQDLGGAIVAAGSEASMKNTGAVTLLDSAQNGAQALNLVNSSQSRVANGVNVWDGQLQTPTGATGFTVNQKNEVFQQGFATYASLSSYKRTDANVWTSSTSSQTSNGSSSDSFTNDSMVDTKQSISSSSGSSSGSDSASPSAPINIQAGQGISGTGKLNIHVDAGSIGVGISGNASATTQHAIDVGGVFNGTTTNTLSAGFNANLNWNLPKLDLSFDGGICYVELGSCSAKGSRDTKSSSTTSSQDTYSQTVLAPISMDDAKAQYIVVDGSKLTTENAYTVLLTGTSEANAKALNLVNAAGSLITNAVNVARTPTVGPLLNLNQSNLIVQQH